MQFQSRIIRNTVFAMLSGSMPDILFALIAAWYINEGYIWAVIIYFGIQALYFAVWLVRSLYMWGYFLLFGRKKMALYLTDFLYKGKFPMPGEYEKSAKDYLSSVAQNQNVDVECRLKAAHELGGLNIAESLGQYQYLFRVSLALEDAIEDYSRSLIRNQK